MPATTSGADTKANGTAKSREHNQGNQDRKYTIEQKAAVVRVRRCAPTAFYDILGLEEVKATVTETEIKKAYRKLSLLTHPDKNGHEHADEAFKMVSRAFGVLSDKDKKTKYDKFGGDPDSRFGGGAPQSNPFSGFSQRSAGGGAAARGGGRSMWEEEISPEEMFQRFFGGGGFGGGGMFNDQPGFVFNLGGGPGIRVHQFGGPRPRRRPRDPNAPPEAPASLTQTLISLLPLLLLFGIPLLSSLFSGEGSSGPSMRFDNPIPPHTDHRVSSRMNVDYYVNPAEIKGYSTHKLAQLDRQAEVEFVQRLKVMCEQEVQQRNQLLQEAQGWFSTDADKIQRARDMPMSSCRKLEGMGVRNQY
ncbi:ac51da4c-f455-4b51-87f2-916363a8a792 [Sclerotinia trifoliorum]|uniref:Ac51da4c-f455-4b51-87f2-916363a8a792 n=1 Tax=Sclerotinia trifoliorum TaxID=28548 RepID=A0A8H2W3V9_9HELO|nr:ac51da4c-f455-4b51-87f2-916363a8a792 [Sclerotinia trifoliorum]